MNRGGATKGGSSTHAARLCPRRARRKREKRQMVGRGVPAEPGGRGRRGSGSPHRLPDGRFQGRGPYFARISGTAFSMAATREASEGCEESSSRGLAEAWADILRQNDGAQAGS